MGAGGDGGEDGEGVTVVGFDVPSEPPPPPQATSARDVYNITAPNAEHLVAFFQSNFFEVIIPCP